MYNYTPYSGSTADIDRLPRLSRRRQKSALANQCERQPPGQIIDFLTLTKPLLSRNKNLSMEALTRHKDLNV